MMPTVKMYDPYRIIDPTEPMPAPELSRTIGGKYSGFTTNAEDNSFPIDSKWWGRIGRGAWERLGRLMGNDYFGTPEKILPNETIDHFSWRMISEMVEAACTQAEKTPSDIPSIVAAAHKYLADKQYEIARAHLDALMGTEAPKELDAIDMSQTLSDWLHESWDLIPEVEY